MNAARSFSVRRPNCSAVGAACSLRQRGTRACSLKWRRRRERSFGRCPPPKTPNSLTEYRLAAPASYCPCVLATKVGVAVGSYTYNLSKNMLFPKASTLSAFVKGVGVREFDPGLLLAGLLEGEVGHDPSSEASRVWCCSTEMSQERMSCWASKLRGAQGGVGRRLARHGPPCLRLQGGNVHAAVH